MGGDFGVSSVERLRGGGPDIPSLHPLPNSLPCLCRFRYGRQASKGEGTEALKISSVFEGPFKQLMCYEERRISKMGTARNRLSKIVIPAPVFIGINSSRNPASFSWSWIPVPRFREDKFYGNDRKTNHQKASFQNANLLPSIKLL